jgi:hypothetical protein
MDSVTFLKNHTNASLFTILTGTTAKQWVFMIIYASINT